MASLFKILVDIGANTANLETGLRQATRKIEDFTSSVEKTATRLAELAGFAVGMDALASSISRAVENGDRLQLLADRMGTSAESLSRLQYAASISEVPFEALTGSLDHLHEVLGRAELGSGRAGKALANMGIDAKKLLDLPFEEQLAVIANKLALLPNPAQRAAREMVLFGQAGAQLDPLLRQGAAGIDKLAQEADAAGVTIDGNMTEKLKAAHDEMVKADAAFKAAATTIAVSLAPVIKTVAGYFKDAADFVKSFGEGLAHYFSGADTPVGQLTDKLKSLQFTYAAVEQQVMKLQEHDKGFIGYPGQSDAQIKRLVQQLDSLDVQIADTQGRLDAAKREAAAANKPHNAGGGSDVAPVNLGVTVDQQKLFTDKMTQLLDQFQHDTETDTEKVAAAWYKLEAELKDLREEGLISQEEYAKRLNESLDSILPTLTDSEIGSLGAKIAKPVKDQFDEMQKLGEKAAASIEQAFANFLFNPFHNSAKRLAIDFLDALRKMAADAAAQKIFKALFRDDSSSAKGAGNSGLGGILGSLFEGSPQGGSAGGANNLTRALSAVSPAASGFLSKLLQSFFGGGGPSTSAGPANAAANPSVYDVPAMADGGLVSAGSSYLVGEEGPELFTAASHGIITPNDALSGGDVTVHMGDTHIDARGADADRVMTLIPPLIARANQQTKADLLQAFRRTGLAAPVRA